MRICFGPRSSSAAQPGVNSRSRSPVTRCESHSTVGPNSYGPTPSFNQRGVTVFVHCRFLRAQATEWCRPPSANIGSKERATFSWTSRRAAPLHCGFGAQGTLWQAPRASSAPAPGASPSRIGEVPFFQLGRDLLEPRAQALYACLSRHPAGLAQSVEFHRFEVFDFLVVLVEPICDRLSPHTHRVCDRQK
jgi:hypothetical protein